MNSLLQLVLKRLYDFNHTKENWEQRPFEGPRSRLAAQSDQWGGPMARRELQAIYTIAFLCLLRSDEVLKIERKHVIFSKNPETLTLTLSHRKTHQDGGRLFIMNLLNVLLVLTTILSFNQVLSLLFCMLCQLQKPIYAQYELWLTGLVQVESRRGFYSTRSPPVIGHPHKKIHPWYVILTLVDVSTVYSFDSKDIRTIS